MFWKDCTLSCYIEHILLCDNLKQWEYVCCSSSICFALFKWNSEHDWMITVGKVMLIKCKRASQINDGQNNRYFLYDWNMFSMIYEYKLMVELGA